MNNNLILFKDLTDNVMGLILFNCWVCILLKYVVICELVITYLDGHRVVDLRPVSRATWGTGRWEYSWCPRTLTLGHPTSAIQIQPATLQTPFFGLSMIYSHVLNACFTY